MSLYCYRNLVCLASVDGVGFPVRSTSVGHKLKTSWNPRVQVELCGPLLSHDPSLAIKRTKFQFCRFFDKEVPLELMSFKYLYSYRHIKNRHY